MVQGLAFLSKKSWHTKNLANQEKVWMAEQKKAAEESKTKELARQIQQEREEEELDKIAGRKSNRKDRGIDWMYQGGSGEAAQEDAKKQAEEYLLGKEFAPAGQAGGDFAGLDTGGVNAVVSNTTAPTAQLSSPTEVSATVERYEEPSVADRNETFRQRLEDPMFLVSQRQHEKESQNTKKRELYERVVGPTESLKNKSRDDDASDGGRKKRSKKEKKREKKRHKRHREDEHHRRRHRSRSHERSRREDRESHRYEHRRSRSRSRSEDRHRHRRSRDERDLSVDSRDRGYSRRRERSRSWSQDQRRHSHRSESPDRRYQRRDHYRDDREPSPRRSDYNDRRPAGFGLQARSSAPSTGHSSIMRNKDDLGPNRELLERRRQEREAARRQGRDRTRPRMSDHERAHALQAMQSDASKRDEALNRAVAAKARGHDDLAHSGKNATFLQEMTEKTHGIREGGSLASRLAENRNSHQKTSDSFL